MQIRALTDIAQHLLNFILGERVDQVVQLIAKLGHVSSVGEGCDSREKSDITSHR